MSLENALSQMVNGTIVTMQLFLITLVISLPLGLCLTLLNSCKNVIIKAISGFYILVLRGTPLLLQLFFIFFGLPYVPVIGKYLTVGRFESAAIAFILNYAAYFAEIFRGGLLAVDKGQYEAAKVLGMNRLQTFIKIVLPQMIRISLPAVSNEAIILVKDTALVTAIGVTELLGTTKTMVNSTMNVAYYAMAAVFYLVMSWLLTLLFKRMENKYRFEQ